MSGTFGITTIQQFLQNILIAFSNINATLKTLAIGASGNNSFTGNNTFTGTNSFKPPPTISEGAVGTGTLLPMGAASNQGQTGGVGNGANTTDDILFSYTLPANSLDTIGRGIIIEAYGGFAANAHDKTVKIFFGSATVFTTGVVTAVGTAWFIRANITNTGANSQVAGGFGIDGSTIIATEVTLPAQVTSTPILITLTGASPTTGAANDVVGYGFTVEFLN